MRLELFLRVAPVAVLLPAMLLGACDEASPSDPATLLTSREEQPGANCARGGSAISGGRDRDDDGVLAESEVESTVYACRPAAQRANDTLSGSVSVWNQDDVDGLVGVKTITGDLVIEADRMATLRFPELQVVGGAIRLGGATAIRAIEFPELLTVGQMIGSDTELGSLSFPKLSTIWDDAVLTVDATIAMPALENVETLEFTIVADGADARVALDSLVTAESLLLAIRGDTVVVNVPRLATLSSRHTTFLAAPLIVRIPETADITFPALTTTGTVRLRGGSSFSFPALDQVDGDVDVVSAGSLAVPTLRSVKGRFLPSGRSVSAPALETVGTLELTGVPIHEASLPALSTITGVCGHSLSSCGLSVVGTSLTALTLPALDAVEAGRIVIAFNPELVSVTLPELSEPADVVSITVDENDALDSCDLQAEVDAWTAAGWTGTRVFDGNGVDTCIE